MANAPTFRILQHSQREFLNFLSNAEREDFQELSTSQNVEMEKSNVRVETARVDQVIAEVAVAQQSEKLGKLTAENAQQRLELYRDFDTEADDYTDQALAGLAISGLASTGSSVLSGAATGAAIGSAGGPIGMAGGAILGGLFGGFSAGGQFTAEAAQLSIADEQREFEKQNLQLALEEAEQAAIVAQRQLEVAGASLVVAGLQRQAALLRHEFALQNLQFLRNRTLNAEQWYRLVAAIRSVSETYLRYSIELAFLAEQAYEFEADKRINVIRFDYDLSEVGDFLAADFLLRDLDTLEKDLIITQRQREQHVRYILSMAREFPEALQEIRENGTTTFSLRLEQLEKRFPGLFNLRIGAVDVLPIALMDSTRFSLELTYLGTSQVRLKAQPDTPPSVPSTSPLNEDDLERFLFTAPANVFANELDQEIFSDQFRQHFTDNEVTIPQNVRVTQIKEGSIWKLSSDDPEKFLVRKKEEILNVFRIEVDDDWLIDIRDEWPVKIRVREPQTAVYSGLIPQDARSVFAFATTGQRQAFESLGAAAAWEVDFTARENQILPGTLADLLITFTLSAYHDPELRKAIDNAQRLPTAVTNFVSGRTTFPDALYEFNRSGLMKWNITRDLLTLTDTLGAVRNVGVLLLPAPVRGNYYGRLMSHCEVRVRITEAGELKVLTEIPDVTFDVDAANPLKLVVQAPSGTNISWDFGDGSARISGASQEHTYAKPGRYTVSFRVVRDGRLSEFQANVVVSRAFADRLSLPLFAFPKLTRGSGPNLPARVDGQVNAPAGETVFATWRIDKLESQRASQATFDLPPGDHTLSFTAVRQLKACLYSTQRQLIGSPFEFNGLSLASNRRFELDGSEITGPGINPPRNRLTDDLFTDGALSPVDEWTIELPLADNPFLRGVGATDVEQHDLGEIQDAVLVLEYETTPGG